MTKKTATKWEFIERLARTHERSLFLYLVQILRSPELARETAQDAFVKMFRAYRLEEMAYPRALLFKIATNLALMQLRRARLERRLFGNEALPDEILHEIRDERLSPEEQAITDEAERHVMDAIKRMQPLIRAPFVMGHVEGRPRCEIAQCLGISEKRVDKRVTKARKALRQTLASSGYEARDLKSA